MSGPSSSDFMLLDVTACSVRYQECQSKVVAFCGHSKKRLLVISRSNVCRNDGIQIFGVQGLQHKHPSEQANGVTELLRKDIRGRAYADDGWSSISVRNAGEPCFAHHAQVSEQCLPHLIKEVLLRMSFRRTLASIRRWLRLLLLGCTAIWLQCWVFFGNLKAIAGPWPDLASVYKESA